MMKPSNAFKVFSRLAWVAGCALFASPSQAAKYTNQFVEFELPPGWQCVLEGAEFVCQNGDPQKKKDAIIILAAKLRGDQDSLDQYLAYLKQPKSYTSVQGKPVKSEVRYAKNTDINGHPWADALHLESEIPGFYTRYLATVKEGIGVLVTYSINKTKYSAYVGPFENLSKTLRVFRKPGGLNEGAQSVFKQTHIPEGLTNTSVFPDAQLPTAKSPGENGESAPQKRAKQNDLVLFLVGAGILGFVIWKRRRRG